MASLDSQGEIVPIELPNPEETQIWEGENQLVHSPANILIWQLLLVIAALIRQASIGRYGNGLIDVEENPKFWNVFDDASCVLSETAVRKTSFSYHNFGLVYFFLLHLDVRTHNNYSKCIFN